MEGTFWRSEIIEGLDKEIHLESLGLTLKMSDIYRDVKFPKENSEA